jgi:hypothetical protein
MTETQGFIKRIQDALGTAEEGDALVEVALNAHLAEMELAARKRADEEADEIYEKLCGTRRHRHSAPRADNEPRPPFDRRPHRSTARP